MLEARPAKHRTTLCGLEGDRGFGCTLRTNCSGFRANAIAGSGHALNLALLAPLWIVLELLIVKEQLFAGGKDKVITTIRTFQYLIDEIHYASPPEHALEFLVFRRQIAGFGIVSPTSLICL